MSAPNSNVPAHPLSGPMQRVLDLAASFSKDKTPEMSERDEATEELAAGLRDALVPMIEVFGLGDLDFNAKRGGRQTNYSPVPWVRVFSEKCSPRALEGFYVVYLFAADGSRVYLSLNQGTSEWRSGAMRPINDSGVLRGRAAEARAVLADFADSPVIHNGQVTIDLAWASVTSVGAESKRRMRNYEDGNLFAYEYETKKIPSHEQLVQDLADMLPLLAELYGTPVSPGELPTVVLTPTAEEPAAKARKAVSRAQGRQLDSAARKAIELHAENLAVWHFETSGWTVERVGHLKLGYDLDCTRDEESLHVEVKGTQTLGEEVILTPNEVRHVQGAEACDAAHALYVVSQITLDRTNGVRCSGGHARLLWPWGIRDAHLTPTQYAYRVPQA
ncbi:DUF3578 domain-containing protein [Lentzea sp. NBRC 102530]|uniref:MrcB family domain-containing protein n=1 Tax=Lentzea sp. NBRC 102530 TaxID=3032201 RepID=UPI0025564353|nr:DUF3578 domain-containing protein [Lentzea sp. NBRC 102530]